MQCKYLLKIIVRAVLLLCCNLQRSLHKTSCLCGSHYRTKILKLGHAPVSLVMLLVSGKQWRTGLCRL